MSDKLLTDAASEPVTAAMLRADLREVSDSDADLLSYAKDARLFFEEQTGLITAEQTRQLTLDFWPRSSSGSGDGLGWWEGERQGSINMQSPRFVELPKGPLISIEEVRLFAADNTSSVWASSNYFADTGRTIGRLALSDNGTIPLPGRSTSGIEIEYKAGYADSADIPTHHLRAIRQLAAHWYENREALDFDQGRMVPLQIQRIIDSCRVTRL